MPVEPSVTHRPQGVFHSVGQHRHVLKVHAAAVIVKVEADKCEIGVVVPQSLKSIATYRVSMLAGEVYLRIALKQ